MSGCRSLSDIEIMNVLNALDSSRDRTLFILGLKTGFRISELLSLKRKDVQVDSKMVDAIRVARRSMKGKEASREVILHPQAKEALAALLSSNPNVPEEAPLFLSGRGYHQPLTRTGAHRALKAAFKKAGVGGAVATHTMRKTFAQKVYKGLEYDLVATSRALAHSDIRNTIRYLQPDKDAINKAILAV